MRNYFDVRSALGDRDPEHGKAKRCAPTEWLRRAVGPLMLAARVESADRPAGAKPVDALDVEPAYAH